MKTLWKDALKISAFLVLLMMTACGSPSRNTTDTNAQTGDDQKLQVPNFDSSPTSPTGTKTGDLFSSQSGSQTAPPSGSGQLGSPGRQESLCLASDQSFNLGQYGLSGSQGTQGTTSTQGTPTPASSTPCFNSGSSFGMDPSRIYGGITNSYKTMDYCLNQAAQYAPQQGMSQLQADLTMQMAELGLVLCMRDLVNYQQQMFPWGNAQMSAFNHMDNNLWQIGQGLRR